MNGNLEHPSKRVRSGPLPERMQKRKEIRMSGISRRDFIKNTAVIGAGLATGLGALPRMVRAAGAEPITILNLMPFSGAYADTGLDVSRGVKMAIEEFGGKVLGREIKLVERDATNPNDLNW